MAKNDFADNNVRKSEDNTAKCSHAWVMIPRKKSDIKDGITRYSCSKCKSVKW